MQNTGSHNLASTELSKTRNYCTYFCLTKFERIHDTWPICYALSTHKQEDKASLLAWSSSYMVKLC